MPPTIASDVRVTVGQPLTCGDLPLMGETPRRVSEGKSVACVDLCALLAAAIDATGQRKEAAIGMGISQPVLTKQLGRVDDAAPRLDRMSGLKPETLIDFAGRVLIACGAGDPRVVRQQAVEEAARALGKLVALAMSA